MACGFTLAEGHILALVGGVGGRELRVCEGLHYASRPIVRASNTFSAGRGEPEVC